jgi:acyl dehydratase
MTTSRASDPGLCRPGAPFRIGDRAIPKTVGPLRLTHFVRYAGASGDYNAMHHDPDLARGLGHPDVFAMGMLPGALLSEFAANWLAPLKIRSIRLRFLDRIWNGDVLVFHGEVVQVDEGPEGPVRSSLWVTTTENSKKIIADCSAQFS